MARSTITPKIIYEDEDILVVDKPAGLVVNRAETQKGETVQDWAEKNSKFEVQGSKLGEDACDFEKRSGIVHRLDKETSGVLIIAKNEKAFVDLQRQFKRREVKKEYLALVYGVVSPTRFGRASTASPDGALRSVPHSASSKLRGVPFSSSSPRKSMEYFAKEGKIDQKEFVVDAPIARNPKNRMKFAVVEGGRAARTKFVVKELYDKSDRGVFTLLKVFPETGRTHQIRVHLAAFNHPVVGDELYAGRKRSRKSREWCPRQFLHAAKIEFKHPGTGELVEYEVKLPAELEKLLK